MDQKAMIDDLVRMLDAGAAKGVGHINVAYDEALPDRIFAGANASGGDADGQCGWAGRGR